MYRYKKITILVSVLLTAFNIAACGQLKEDEFAANQQESNLHMVEGVNLEKIHHINISGNARSIVIKQSESESFAFHNEDLNTAHTYKVYCDENGDTLDINIMMENAQDDNNILGSFHIEVPQKEFETIEVTGNFRQVVLGTINSDTLIHANNSSVNLDLQAEHLEHNIMLEGSETNAFRSVLVYFDTVPDNVKLEFNVLQGGIINDPDNILEENRLETGTGKPVISINNTKEINIYREE